jgi:hypothetical protein
MNAIEFLITAINLFIGLMFGSRILSQMQSERLITTSERRKMTGISVSIAVFVVMFAPKDLILLWFVLGIICLGLYLSRFLIRQHRSMKFRQEFVVFLDRAILNLRSGHSLRQSLKLSSLECDAFTQHQLNLILEFVFFSQHYHIISPDEFVKSMMDELFLIDQSGHRSLQRLEVLRRGLKIESDFRRRSAQGLIRVRWQAYLMTGLYIAILIFVLKEFSLKEISRLLFISVTFFGTGFVWILMGGRKIKWKL